MAGVVSDSWLEGLPDAHTVNPGALGLKSGGALFVCKQEDQILLCALKPDNKTVVILYQDGGFKDASACLSAISESRVRILFSSSTTGPGSESRLRSVVYDLPVEYKVYIPLIRI
jgi:hypothetical protein